MIIHISRVRYLHDYTLELTFDNTEVGVVDLSDISFSGIFKPLKDKEYFKQVSVDTKLGTIVWPNGADIAPDTLYKKAKVKV